MTSARSPRVVATKRGKVIDQRDANPCLRGKPSRKVIGLIPGAGKGFFYCKITVGLEVLAFPRLPNNKSISATANES